MSTIELVFITVVTIVISVAGVFLLYLGSDIATTNIIKDQKVCVNASSSGVEFTKCFKLVAVEPENT